jgi:aminoglycoside phosphotransferase family enzyme
MTMNAMATSFSVDSKCDMRSRSLAALLSDPSSYPDLPTSVQIVETHISWVFLTDKYAYKLKKPVTFELIDFSTPELRHWACQEEMRLNRRMTTDVYISVLPIVETPGGAFELKGKGRPIDWVVQMRRLPAERAMDVLLRNNKFGRDEMTLIADYLAQFYARIPPKLVTPEHFHGRLERHVRTNGAALLSSLPSERDRIRRIQRSQLRYLRIQAEEFYKRASAGRVVDGHGDLRPEHIYVETTPAIIDCIEFSDELREVDIADELSFLAMECERLGDAGPGETVIESYKRACRDEVSPRILAFYRTYRACVRAKVALYRCQQLNNRGDQMLSELVHEYLDLADLHVQELGVLRYC